MAQEVIKDFGLITEDEKLIRRVTEICEEFDYLLEVWPHAEAFMESGEQCRLVVFSCDGKKNEQREQLAQKATEVAQSISYQCAEAFKIAVINRFLDKNDVQFLKKSGVEMVLSSEEVFDTSKLEFISTQYVRAQYIPVKELDLVANVSLPFDLYHLMPLSRKFLKIVAQGRELSDKRMAKMKDVGEFYIHRDKVDAFKQFTKELAQGDNGLLRRCRGQFLEFYTKYTDLVMLLSDQSESASFEEGKQLLEGCNEMVKELASCLAEVSVDSIWDIVNNSSIGEFGSLERSPAIAAYASFFALKMGYENIEDVIFASLIGDIGLIFLEPAVTRKLRRGGEEQMTAEEFQAYRKYPVKSVDVVLNRKLPLSNEIKEIALKAHERSDGQGFPKGLNSVSLCKESQLLGFSWHFDNLTSLKMGDQRVCRKTALADVLREELSRLDRFTPSFLMDMKKTFMRKIKSAS